MKIFGKLWMDGDCSTIFEESNTKNEINENINNSTEKRNQRKNTIGHETRPVCGVSVYTAAATLSSLAQSGCMEELLVCPLEQNHGSKVRTYIETDV